MKSFLVLSLLVDVAAGGSKIMAQSPGTFTATGNMTTERAGHTATLLTNGKVLIAGGLSTGFPAKFSASVELYDPATGTFTSTGNMTAPRGQHTATLLADGRILIAGGWNGASQNLASAELYDPSTGTFTPTGAMITLRGLHQATSLPDGRVLVTRCATQSVDLPSGEVTCSSAITELYDPATGRFADAGTPGAGGAAATLQADGRVLITTGCRGDFRGTKTQLFDPATGTFSFTGLRAGGCEDGISTATLLTNGQILFAGSGGAGYLGDAELYDAVAGTFTSLGQMIGPHHLSAATLIPDGTVLVTGSQLPGGNGDPGAELYTPATGRFTLAGKMIAGRHNHTATLLPDGSVLIAGGYTVWPGATASAEIYRPSVLIPAPVLYSLSGDGRGQSAILHAGTARVVTAGDPGVPGEVLEIYGTGLKDGSVIPPQVAIGGRLAEVLFFGKAPGFAGLNQVNVRVPGGITPGAGVPVRLTYLGRPSNAVTIGVQ